MHTRITLPMLLILTALPCAADTVYLQNGDRITGTVLELTPDMLRVDTGYAGTLDIARTAVAGVETDEPFEVTGPEGAVWTGPLRVIPDGWGIEAADGLAVLPVDALVSARPTGVDPDPPPPAEEEEEADTPRRWSGHVESGLTVRSGNTDTTDFKLATRLVRKTERHTLTFKGSAAYGEASGVLNTRRTAGEARWQYAVHDPLYLYLLGGAERDDGRKLDLRLFSAAGVGYTFIDAETRSLSADIGFDYTWERWAPFTPAERDAFKSRTRLAALSQIPAAFEDVLASGWGLAGVERLSTAVLDYLDPTRSLSMRRTDDVSLRLSAAYTQQLFKRSTLEEVLVVYPNLSEFGEVRVVSELAFSTPLSESLRLNVSLRTEYDSLARQSDVDAWDNTLITGLRYEF